MSDLPDILRAYDRARAVGVPAVLATVVATSGSTYRRPGARMMLAADGARVGVVSGGCLEGDVTRRAWFLRAPGDAELVRYDTGSGEDATYEFGLGCRGVVDVLLQRLDTAVDPPVIAAIRQVVETRKPVVLATAIRTSSASLRVGEHWTLGDLDESEGVVPHEIDGAKVDLFVERLLPPISLLVFGSGIDVKPVVSIAKSLGWNVTVIDSAASATRQNFPLADVVGRSGDSELTVDERTAAVVMTHRFDDDVEHLATLLPSDVAYVGVLGPRSRTEAVLEQLTTRGPTITPDLLARLHAPIGLDVGAERPEEIALSIVAEVQAALAQRVGGKLRDQTGPIHRQRKALSLSAATVVSDLACPM